MYKKVLALMQKVWEFIKKNPKLTIIIGLVLMAGYIYMTVEMLHMTSVPKFCELCHPEKKSGPLSEVYTWSKNIHASKGVECLDCHGKPGFVGYIKAKLGGLGDIYGFVAKSTEHKMSILTRVSTDPEYAAEVVPNEICLFCHSDSYNQKIRKERIMSVGFHFRKLDGVKNPEFRKSMGLRDILTEELKSEADPNHSKHIAAGITCMDCHLGVAHGGEFKNKVKIENCVNCHAKRKDTISMSDIRIGKDDRTVTFSHIKHTAMFKCTDCHTKLFPMKKGRTKIAFEDHSKNKYCYSCHNGKNATSNCNICHGGKLPEMLEFGKGDKKVNYNHKMHADMFPCNTCHTKVFQMKKGSAKIVFADHSKDKYCYTCHNEKKASFDCNKCHTKGMMPKGPLTYKVEGMGPVNFSHELHTGMFKCNECHTSIWSMKKGGRKMKMDDLYGGKYCGKCHNGTMAFETTQCEKCHIIK